MVFMRYFSTNTGLRLIIELFKYKTRFYYVDKIYSYK